MEGFEKFLFFGLGVGMGFVLGILFAPASGEETRRKLKEGGVRAIRVAKEKSVEGIERVQAEVAELKSKLKELSAKLGSVAEKTKGLGTETASENAE